MKRIMLASWFIGLLAFLVGCAAANMTEEEEEGQFFIGNIVEIHRSDSNSDDGILGSILVEGVLEGSTQVQSASITIMDDTKIFEQRGQGLRQITFEAGDVGQSVQVQFAGPVRETYPIQGIAAELTIQIDDR